MNVDENQDFAAMLGIQSVPTMILFKNNKEIQNLKSQFGMWTNL